MRTRDLPSAVLERYAARQSVCFCGVLPEIGRAWATVDNALFLWRFDVPDDKPVEYAGDAQAIVSVALATPKADVFLPTMERLIIVATTTEIVLLGAAFETEYSDGRDANGRNHTTGTTNSVRDPDDPNSLRIPFSEKEMTLHALDYACVTDDVVVKDFACTSSGRYVFIFFFIPRLFACIQ